MLYIMYVSNKDMYINGMPVKRTVAFMEKVLKFPPRLALFLSPKFVQENVFAINRGTWMYFRQVQRIVSWEIRGIFPGKFATRQVYT